MKARIVMGIIIAWFVPAVASQASFLALNSAPSPDDDAKSAITLVNNIDPESLGYKRFGTHYPTSFHILIQNQVVAQGHSHAIAPQGNKLSICYEYAFLWGQYRGKKEISFELEPNQTECILTFSWHDPNRLQLSHAKVVAVKVLEKK